MGMLQLGSRGRLSLLSFLVAPGALALGCSDDIVNHYATNNYYTDGGAEPEPPASGGKSTTGGKTVVPVDRGGEGGMPVEVAGGSGGANGGQAGDDSGIDPRYPDAPLVDTSVDELPLDIFDTVGNHYWFAVSDEQLAAMNGGQDGGICCFQDGLYTPGGSGKANWVDHLFVTTATDPPQTADFGKVQAKIVGQYSRFPWDSRNIPNLNVDSDQFIEGQRIAGYEHLRFSNGQRGSIFRDKLAYDLYRMLGYTAPLATFAWVSSNVWGPEISIPYTLVERYKRTFCDRYAEEFGGGCPNMWEYASDFNWGMGGGGKGGPIFNIGQPSLFDDPETCQMGTCDPTRVKELEAKLLEPVGEEGFKAALSEYIDWPAMHRFQCLAWVLSTSDDTIHAPNNVVLVEGDDGLFRFLPYSIDLSMGSWGAIDLRGNGNAVVRGCQDDTTCWSDTLDVCEDVIADFKELKPREYLQAMYDELDEHGMLRSGDERNFQEIDAYFVERLENLSSDLEQYRTGNYCQYPYVDCNGQCVYQDECYCNPGPIPGGEAGAPGRDDVAPPPIGVGGAAAVGGAPAAGGMIGAGGGAVGGGGPICPVKINYALAPQ